LLLCWRTEEQSAFVKPSANIGQTNFNLTFVLNFIISNFIRLRSRAGGYKIRAQQQAGCVSSKFVGHSIMHYDSKRQKLRTELRKNSKSIIKNLVTNHIQRNTKVPVHTEICMFCSSPNNLTKEHVLPRWVFDNSTKRFFTTDINGFNQTYIKTTIPVCSTCNSDILNSLEKYIQNIFENRDIKKTPFSSEEVANIIRWLEIIDYKFQILNVRRKFKASKKVGYISYLADFPLSILRKSIEYSPIKAITEIRRSQKRVSTKSKQRNTNSLITFKTKNKDFHFFHHMDDFIFLELPRQQIAVFHFYKKEFDNELNAYEDAMNIIETFY
jgi:hypothetical protein